MAFKVVNSTKGDFCGKKAIAEIWRWRCDGPFSGAWVFEGFFASNFTSSKKLLDDYLTSCENLLY